MKLKEYESLIKKQFEENRYNEEIYVNLQKMIEMFLRRKKVCNCSKDYEDMSYIMAGDLYLKFINEEKTPDYLLGYLAKAYQNYAHEYYDENSGALGQIPVEEIRTTVLSPNSYSYEVNCVNSKVYLQEIVRVIDEIMMNSCKYDPNSVAFMNLKLSLILTVLKEELTPFHLNQEQVFYLNLIYINFKNKIVKDGFDLDENYYEKG